LITAWVVLFDSSHLLRDPDSKSSLKTVGPGPGGGGVTTGTEIEAVPVFPSLVAEIAAEPEETALTRPAPETVATDGLLELQVTVRPVSTLLFASRVTAESCAVAPIWMVAEAGATDTDATGTGGGGAIAATVSGADPVFPSLVATIVAEPAVMAVTTPPLVTEATLAFELDHVTARSVRVLPFASRTLATAVAFCPTVNEDALSETETLATGIAGIGNTLSVA